MLSFCINTSAIVDEKSDMQCLEQGTMLHNKCVVGLLELSSMTAAAKRSNNTCRLPNVDWSDAILLYDPVTRYLSV